MTKPLLHLVFGGEVADPRGTDYLDVRGLDLVGIYPNYAEAFKAWRAASQRHVDQSKTRADSAEGCPFVDLSLDARGGEDPCGRPAYPFVIAPRMLANTASNIGGVSRPVLVFCREQ